MKQLLQDILLTRNSKKGLKIQKITFSCEDFRVLFHVFQPMLENAYQQLHIIQDVHSQQLCVIFIQACVLWQGCSYIITHQWVWYSGHWLRSRLPRNCTYISLTRFGERAHKITSAFELDKLRFPISSNFQLYKYLNGCTHLQICLYSYLALLSSILCQQDTVQRVAL